MNYKQKIAFSFPVAYIHVFSLRPLTVAVSDNRIIYQIVYKFHIVPGLNSSWYHWYLESQNLIICVKKCSPDGRASCICINRRLSVLVNTVQCTVDISRSHFPGCKHLARYSMPFLCPKPIQVSYCQPICNIALYQISIFHKSPAPSSDLLAPIHRDIEQAKFVDE